MRSLLRAIGYDPEIVDGLAPAHARLFRAAALASVLAALVVGVGTGAGGLLTLGLVVAVPLGVAGALFLVNLLRLHHAGSGYPLHLPVDDIARWRPAPTASVVLLLLGALLAQPLAFLVLKPVLDDTVAQHIAEQRAVRAQLGIDDGRGPADGIILRATVAWQEPAATAPVVLGLALLVALPALLRRFGAGAVRAYESERWIRERMFVDDEFARAQEAVTNMLRGLPGFSGSLEQHYADPPYNTKPLVYGLDPALFVNDAIKLVRPGKVDGDAVILDPAPSTPAAPPAPAPAPARAPAAAAPTAPAAPPRVQPAPVAPARDEDESEARGSVDWDAPSAQDAELATPPSPAFFDVGRAQVKRAQAHVDVVAPVIASFTGRSVSEVRAILAGAPEDARLHRLFPEWKKPTTILLKDAGFALDFGLAPVLSIIVGRPVVDVERRLRAVPRDKKLPAVFAPELARRLLKKKSAP